VQLAVVLWPAAYAMLNIRVRSDRGDRQENRGIGSLRKQQPFKYRKIVPKAIRPHYSGHPLELRRILKRIFKPPVALKVLIYEHNDYKLYTYYIVRMIYCIMYINLMLLLTIACTQFTDSLSISKRKSLIMYTNIIG